MLRDLNPVQLEAVTFGDGPLLVLAGAGSGKTRVLTSRIAWLIRERGVAPGSILAVTFTNKAAGEMRERLTTLIGDDARALWLGTFHSLGLRLLRREGTRAGLGAGLTVYNDDDQLSLVRQVMAELEISEKGVAPRAILARINGAKNELVDADAYAARARDFISERAARVYSRYQEKLREFSALDFGDLICEPVRIFRDDPDLLDDYKRRIRYILVDEYQDTNRAQYVFTGQLASGSRNLLVVGDPDQSIYAWRGADINNILDFESDYPDATVLRLEQNYRSTGRILAAANSVIEKNSRRMEKTLWTENPDGAVLEYVEADDEYDEARTVIKRLVRALGADPSLGYRDFAVFYRTNAQSRVFEEKLLEEGIPYAIVGGVRFYDRLEIRDALAYLRVVANPDDALSLRRIINTPARGVGKTTFERVVALAEERGVPLFEAFRMALNTGLLKKTRVAGFMEACDSFKGDAGREPLSELAMRLLEDTGYIFMWQDQPGEEAAARVENLFELISAIKDFERAGGAAPGVQGEDGAPYQGDALSTLSAFLDAVSLISDVDSYEGAADRLTLMTLHSAKGLEFKGVFLVGMEEGLFPHSRSSDDPDELEEERRLCYVGMTRARERLYLSSARARTIYGEKRYQMRSRFVDEIPGEYIEDLSLGSVHGPRPGVYTDGEPYYTTEGSQLDGEPDLPGDGAELPAWGAPGGFAWRVGMRVRHPSFGVGVVKESSGAGENAKLTVRFAEAGVKRLALKYASLVPLG